MIQPIVPHAGSKVIQGKSHNLCSLLPSHDDLVNLKGGKSAGGGRDNELSQLTRKRLSRSILLTVADTA